MSVVDEIKDRLDIIEFIGQYVPLKKAGRNYKGLCPFHSEKTPSFIVFPDSKTWHCFGACGIGGDILTFVMRRENLEFREALEELARRAGISLRPQTPQEATAHKAMTLLAEINDAAAAQFNHWLTQSNAGAQARRYLEKRGLNQESWGAFQLGYAPDEWHALEQALTAKGYRIPDIISAGLLSEREDGGHHDRFRGRLTFPIRDIRGQVVGFGGRVLDDALPKYLNSPQTPLFDKSSILYGIDLAKDAIREQGLAVIVEGYMDVLMAHQHGIRNVVASMGTALTEPQLKILKRLTKKIALALDSDAAGDRGTLRGLETAKQVLDYQAVPVPTSRGLVDYEARLDTEIKIITLPTGLDPDEIIRSDAAEWARLVESSLPVVDYYFQALTRDLDLSSSQGKAEAVHRLVPVITESGGAIEQAHYVQKLARLVKMDERALEKELGRTPRLRVTKPARKEGRFSGFPGMAIGVEKYCIFVLLQNPKLLGVMDGVLERANLAPLGAEDFQDAWHRELLARLQSLGPDEELLDLDSVEAGSALDTLRAEFSSFLQYTASLPEADLTLAASRCALQLRKAHLEHRLLELRYLNEEAQRDQVAEDRQRWMALVMQYTRDKGRLDEALSKVTVLGYRAETPAV
ncbi:MAG: DNA primase [Chloroflexi bacterium]|nr:DNA primase [Chloroflexota bacterium]